MWLLCTCVNPVIRLCNRGPANKARFAFCDLICIPDKVRRADFVPSMVMPKSMAGKIIRAKVSGVWRWRMIALHKQTACQDCPCSNTWLQTLGGVLWPHALFALLLWRRKNNGVTHGGRSWPGAVFPEMLDLCNTAVCTLWRHVCVWLHVGFSHRIQGSMLILVLNRCKAVSLM